MFFLISLKEYMHYRLLTTIKPPEEKYSKENNDKKKNRIQEFSHSNIYPSINIEQIITSFKYTLN